MVPSATGNVHSTCVVMPFIIYVGVLPVPLRFLPSACSKSVLHHVFIYHQPALTPTKHGTGLLYRNEQIAGKSVDALDIGSRHAGAGGRVSPRRVDGVVRQGRAKLSSRFGGIDGCGGGTVGVRPVRGCCVWPRFCLDIKYFPIIIVLVYVHLFCRRFS